MTLLARRPPVPFAALSRRLATHSTATDVSTSEPSPTLPELPPKSLLPATFHAITHGDPALTLHLRSHHLPLLNLFVHFAVCAADALAIPLSRPVPLPKQRRLWTVPRSPFVHKKSQENFERIVHKRVIKAWDADPRVVDVWRRYLCKHELAGVGMRMVKWDRVPLRFAERTKAMGGPKPTDAERVKQLSEVIIRKNKDLLPQPKATKPNRGKAIAKVSNSSTEEAQLKLNKPIPTPQKPLTHQTHPHPHPSRIAPSLIELSTRVRIALQGIPRYPSIRPRVSVADAIEEIYEEELDRAELEEGERERVLKELREGARRNGEEREGGMRMFAAAQPDLVSDHERSDTRESDDASIDSHPSSSDLLSSQSADINASDLQQESPVSENPSQDITPTSTVESPVLTDSPVSTTSTPSRSTTLEKTFKRSSAWDSLMVKGKPGPKQ